MASGTKLGTLAHLDRGITVMYKNLPGVYIARAGHVHNNWTSFYFFRLQGKPVDGYDSNFVGRWPLRGTIFIGVASDKRHMQHVPEREKF